MSKKRITDDEAEKILKIISGDKFHEFNCETQDSPMTAYLGGHADALSKEQIIEQIKKIFQPLAKSNDYHEVTVTKGIDLPEVMPEGSQIYVVRGENMGWQDHDINGLKIAGSTINTNRWEWDLVKLRYPA